MLNAIVSFIYFVFIRRIYKWFFRKFTGRCELLRITLSETRQGPRTFQIESSLKYSRFHQLHCIPKLDDGDTDDLVSSVVAVKCVDISRYPQFPVAMKVCVSQIIGYRRLMHEVEALRKVQYSSSNSEHEALLMQLWKSLQPETVLTGRISDQWSDIGFQGTDPATDFRGMGLLGLQNLVYFSSKYNAEARRQLVRSHHPQFGYSFAIVGINLTSVAVRLLRSNLLKSHFYNAVLGPPQLNDFHNIYVYLFSEFDKFWFNEQPADIMQFNVVLGKFEKVLTHSLGSQETELKLGFN